MSRRLFQYSGAINLDQLDNVDEQPFITSSPTKLNSMDDMGDLDSELGAAATKYRSKRKRILAASSSKRNKSNVNSSIASDADIVDLNDDGALPKAKPKPSKKPNSKAPQRDDDDDDDILILEDDDEDDVHSYNGLKVSKEVSQSLPDMNDPEVQKGQAALRFVDLLSAVYRLLIV